MVPLLLSPANQFPFDLKNQTLQLLERCSNMEELKQIHAHMLKTGLIQDTIPVSKVISFCATSDSGDVEYARRVFDGVESRNTFMWSTMIRGYSRDKDPEQAILLYHQMLHNSVLPNAHIFPFLLTACVNVSALEETEQIHAHILKTGFSSDIYAANALLNAYIKPGCLISGCRLFERIENRDTVSWNLMVDGHVKSGDIQTALELFHQMPAKNVISWTSVISGCVAGSMFKEAQALFHEMQTAGIKPDRVTLASMLSACAHVGSLDQGRWIHAYVDKNRIPIDQVLGCCLIDMYAKCGDVEEAFRVFRNMEQKGVTIWTAMITGFAVHGRGQEAIDLFAEMQKKGVKPNPITFTAVLNACSHAGLVEEGKFFFDRIERTYGMTPSMEHYGCMVDLLGRAGQLKEAEELIQAMPMKPNAAVWGALLNACYMHKNFELGKIIGRYLIEIDPEHGGRYIHLASILAAEGQWQEALQVRNLMKRGEESRKKQLYWAE
ncbi:hypothetical protein Syun_015654 [Stephania yunnanensis]|uniref:Pentatricopeptide repeat-containing protein n=1 Tax=Stephania yunnanensis TaxID=152371 RepID=A0AAP0JM46_9MAGN